MFAHGFGDLKRDSHRALCVRLFDDRVTEATEELPTQRDADTTVRARHGIDRDLIEVLFELGDVVEVEAAVPVQRARQQRERPTLDAWRASRRDLSPGRLADEHTFEIDECL